MKVVKGKVANDVMTISGNLSASAQTLITKSPQISAVSTPLSKKLIFFI